MGWGLYNTLDASNAVDVLERAIKEYGAPEIINSDQVSQHTSEEWLEACGAYGIKVSMDGMARYLDNIWIERFWKTARICSLESRDLLTTTTTTVATKESTVQYQASSTFVSQLGLD